MIVWNATGNELFELLVKAGELAGDEYGGGGAEDDVEKQ